MATTIQESTAEAAGSQRPAVVITASDIVFHCPACGGELVVDRQGAGMTCPCSHCGHSLVVPEYRATAPDSVLLTAPAPLSPPTVALSIGVAPLDGAGVSASPAKSFDFSAFSVEQLEQRLLELRNQLKENQSQDMEMRGHVNRATIDLHRLQLKLKKLQERQAEIEAEIVAVRARNGG